MIESASITPRHKDVHPTLPTPQLAAPHFNPTRAAALLGLPPLASDGEAILRAVHTAALDDWEATTGIPFEDRVESLVRKVEAAYDPNAAAVALHLNRGFVPTEFGQLRGTGMELSTALLRNLSLFTIGSLLAANQGPDRPHKLVLSTPDGVHTQNLALPDLDPTTPPITITTFASALPEGRGSIETETSSLAWQLSGGVLALSSPEALVRLNISQAWVSISIGVALALACN